jgi:hypothetical protein
MDEDEEGARITFDRETIVTADHEVEHSLAKREIDYVHPLIQDGDTLVLCCHCFPADEIANEENMEQKIVKLDSHGIKMLKRIERHDSSSADWLIPHLERVINAHHN